LKTEAGAGTGRGGRKGFAESAEGAEKREEIFEDSFAFSAKPLRLQHPEVRIQ
jgi:hypothetical protein